MGNATKLGIAVVLFAVAALVFLLRGDKEVPRVAEDARKPAFLCTACEHHFEMDYEKAQEALKAAPSRDAPDEPIENRTRRGRRDRLPKLISCEKCGEAMALRANHCKQHDVFYPALNADGSKGECSKCL